MVDRIVHLASMVGVSLNVKKCKVLCLHTNSPSIVVGNEVMEQVTSFRYLGSEISVPADASAEVSLRISRAQAAFSMLSRCLWSRSDISVKTKCHVFTAAVRSVLLYGCETWPLRSCDVKRLSVFEHNCLRKILRISILDHVQISDL